MLSKGQLIFAICFAVLFILVIILTYKKDKALHRKHYSGVFKIVAGFILFVLLLFFIKYMLKK